MTNLEALRQIVREMAQEFGTTLDGLEWNEEGQARVAAWLAAKNLLAVDSLTDEQAATVAPIWNPDVGRWHWDTADQLRTALRRCATGEPQ